MKQVNKEVRDVLVDVLADVLIFFRTVRTGTTFYQLFLTFKKVINKLIKILLSAFLISWLTKSWIRGRRLCVAPTIALCIHEVVRM